MKRPTFWALIVFVFMSLAFSGCDFSGNSGKPGAKDGDGGTGKPAAQKVSVKVYRADQSTEWLVPEIYDREPREGEKAEKLALDILVGEAPQNKNLANIFPAGVKVLSVKTENGLATVDFSKELLKPGTGGSAYEMLLTGAVVDTLTEFPEIKSVQILVEGKKIETINGHMDLLDPLQRNESLIKKK